ncbi:MAG: YjbQ family protein [Nitrospinota bacterium]|nr:YjbQ family protein [Nitrospinota bacterium]MDP6619595.1 YjbQ family protein [Nitrospinota bacterium]
MTARAIEFSLSTRGFGDAHDITERVAGCVADSEIEAGAVSDLKAALERIAPRDIPYEHDARWGDGNGFSHVRAALLGPSLSVPFVQGRLLLGTWQQIVLLDCDNRPRDRRVIVQVVG